MTTDCCGRGHPYTPENLRIVTIRGAQVRQCRECDKQRAQVRRDIQRGDRPKFKKVKLIDVCFREHPMSGDNLYYYETANGRQRRCRACEDVRRKERIAKGETVQPTKTHCLRGHAMEGDNLSFRLDGYPVCLKCQLTRTTKHKNYNYDEVLERKRLNRAQRKAGIIDTSGDELRAILAEQLPEDELVAKIRAALPPPEA